jgi:hypothetical protein
VEPVWNTASALPRLILCIISPRIADDEHLVVLDAHLSLLVTAANTNDSLVFEALLDDLPRVRTPAGGRRCRPDKCHADKAYDHRRCRAYLTRRGIKVRIARCGIESSTRLGRHRKAERSIAWLAGCRRLRIRYDRDSERCFAFAMLSCARLGYNRLPSTAEAHARSP